MRLGTPALTTRGMKQKDFKQIAVFLDAACKMAVEIQAKCGSKKLKDFRPLALQHEGIRRLREQVVRFSSQFPMPGVKLD